MRFKFLWAAAILAATVPVCGQSLDDLNIQFHGYATQGFLYTTHNSIFYSNSSSGSPAWTEAVFNMTAQPNPELRVGVQARYQLLGGSGNAISLDWAEADYKARDEFGVRFGKVKTPWGLSEHLRHHYSRLRSRALRRRGVRERGRGIEGRQSGLPVLGRRAGCSRDGWAV
jgi:hypothetical protein